ncbi:unnamed protein product [Chondrus crispus]|uniref:Uncharacterized protein n=1 Tax=Chondrus crispus TaxID=2769 RepID=R7QAE5_CHOCR|nr:unnamed protein product [Chondrus crispus]CDF34401.1 unnamed protein product [Chondrus crispus]|eukprot:XP_005714220.1 unnamed protein product [Chondrus crispus]
MLEAGTRKTELRLLAEDATPLCRSHSRQKCDCVCCTFASSVVEPILYSGPYALVPLRVRTNNTALIRSGTIRWQNHYPARTLLLESAVVAFDPVSHAYPW